MNSIHPPFANQLFCRQPPCLHWRGGIALLPTLAASQWMDALIYQRWDCNRLAYFATGWHKKSILDFARGWHTIEYFFVRLFFFSKISLTTLSFTNTKLNMSWFWKIKFPGWPTWPPPTAQCVPTAGEWHLFWLNWEVEEETYWMAKLFFLALCKLRSYQLSLPSLRSSLIDRKSVFLLYCTNKYKTQIRNFFLMQLKCKPHL